MAHREAHSPTTEEHNGNAEARFSGEEAGGRPSDARSAEADSTRDWMDPQTMQRAEEMVDRLADSIGSYARRIGHQVLRLAARAREEAEDIWAEARERRRTGGAPGD